MVYISPARFVLFSLLSTVSVFSVISFNNVGTIPKFDLFFSFFSMGRFGWGEERDGKGRLMVDSLWDWVGTR